MLDRLGAGGETADSHVELLAEGGVGGWKWNREPEPIPGSVGQPQAPRAARVATPPRPGEVSRGRCAVVPPKMRDSRRKVSTLLRGAISSGGRRGTCRTPTGSRSGRSAA